MYSYGSGFDTRATSTTYRPYLLARYMHSISIISSSHQRSPDRQAGLGGAEDKDTARSKVTAKEEVKDEVEKRDLRILKRNMLKTLTQCGVDPSQSFKGSYDLLGIVLVDK